MIPTILHIYGPLAIQSYGLMICLGIAVGVGAALRHPWSRGIARDQFWDLITYAICAGVIGGRLLHIATEPGEYASVMQWFTLWDGGFSILGTIAAISFFIPWYLRRHSISPFPLFDLCALYAPLVQSISRIGCFLAGCCGGAVTTMPWGIVCKAGHGPVHPTQLYSALLLMLIFLLLRYVIAPYFRRPGQILAWYFMFIGFERGVVDFWRSDRIMLSKGLLSVHQYGALECIIAGFIILAVTVQRKQQCYEHF